MNEHGEKQDQGKNVLWRDETDLADELRTRMQRVGRLSPVAVADAQTPDQACSSQFVYSQGQAHEPQWGRESAAPQPLGASGAAWSWRSASGMSSGVSQGYHSPMFLANILICMLTLKAAYHLIVGALHFQRITNNILTTSNIGTLEGRLSCVIAIGFVAWTYYLYGNLAFFGVSGLRTSAGMAAASLVTPLVNFVMPYRVFGEIWSKSDPRVRPSNPGARELPSPDPLTALWWFSVTVACLLRFAPTLTHHLEFAAGKAFIFGNIAAAGATLLSIAIVWRLSNRQEDKFSVLQNG